MKSLEGQVILVWFSTISIKYSLCDSIYELTEADLETWNDGVLREDPSISSKTECALLCQNEATCSLFHQENQICQLSRHTPGSCVKQSDSTESHIAVFKQTNLELKEGEEAQTHLVTSGEEKSFWEADQASPVAGDDVETNGAKNVIDGQHTYSNPTSLLYHSITYQDDTSFPWVQIKLDREHWVKGGIITSRESWPNRHSYKEIRVGNVDISGASSDEMLCQNQLCYTTGVDQAALLGFDCATPLKGQFITIQKYKHQNEKIFEMIEVDIEVYCGPFLNDGGKTCLINEGDSCKRKSMATENTKVVGTQSEKASWVMSASSVYNLGFIHEPSYAKNGDKAGNPVVNNLFHTKMHITDGDTFPWLQIDLTQSKLVKGVHLYSRTDMWVGKQFRWSEVRVGNIDAGAITPLGTRFCVNELCKTTGGSESASNTDDCSSPPLSGQYVTIQRTKYEENPTDNHLQALAIAEVDVLFYI